LTQVEARGGRMHNSGSTTYKYAGAGTIYLFTTSSTHGDLIVDHEWTDALVPPNTPLPQIGSGTVGTASVDGSDPADLWIEPQDANQTFALGVVGAWVRIDGSDYRVVDQSADRRQLLLDGAAGIVTTGDTFAGVYKFDTVTVRNGATLEFLDTAEVTTYDVDGDSQVITP